MKRQIRLLIEKLFDDEFNKIYNDTDLDIEIADKLAYRLTDDELNRLYDEIDDEIDNMWDNEFNTFFKNNHVKEIAFRRWQNGKPCQLLQFDHNYKTLKEEVSVIIERIVDFYNYYNCSNEYNFPKSLLNSDYILNSNSMDDIVNYFKKSVKSYIL